MDKGYHLLYGDCRDKLQGLEDQSVHCVVTSPPYYGLRDYKAEGQIGLEPTPEEYIKNLVQVFRQVWRVLRDDGTVWLNLGDSYNANGRSGHGTRVGYKQGTNRASATGSDNPHPSDNTSKPKDLLMIPARVALALQADGWYLRSEIVWAKPNPMPESVKDRPTSAHEKVFLLSKQQRYFYDAEAVREPVQSDKGNARSFRGGGDYTAGNSFYNHVKKERETHGNKPNDEKKRNMRNVWHIATRPCPEAHFAVFPPDLVEPCVKAGCPKGGTVLDPFAGLSTTGQVALQLGRRFIGIELQGDYLEPGTRRLKKAWRGRGLLNLAETEQC